MTHVDKATELFGKKFHCSQAVFAAFSEELELEEKQALKIVGGILIQSFFDYKRVEG